MFPASYWLYSKKKTVKREECKKFTLVIIALTISTADFNYQGKHTHTSLYNDDTLFPPILTIDYYKNY